jgi:hypothetical protein
MKVKLEKCDCGKTATYVKVEMYRDGSNNYFCEDHCPSEGVFHQETGGFAIRVEEDDNE